MAAHSNRIPTYAHDEKGRPTEVVRFESSGGVPIFLLPVETFPGHINNLYLILLDGEETLLDVGSGMPRSNREITARFGELRDRFGVSIEERDLARVVISHAHIDHFGGANRFRAIEGVEIAIHELDARVLSNFEERVVVASKDVDVFLRRAGVHLERRQELTSMYTASKQLFSSLAIDRRLRHGDVLPGGVQVHHAAGHCPGLVCLRLDDVMFTSDHVLARVTPNQMPQSITPFTGLENYLRALEKIGRVEGIELALGGHEAPMADMYARIEEIGAHHRGRLTQILDLVRTPHTVKEIADALFGDQAGYGRMLAYTEAGAHVEYLYQLGELHLANLEEVTAEADPVLRYVR